MSLASFDKFCEKMILGEPGSEKEIFDERQNIVRGRLTTEALAVGFALSGLLVLTNEISEWCSEMFMLMGLGAALCYLWWVIRNAIKGSLFGVKGSGTFWTAVIMLIDSFYLLLMCWEPEKAFPLTEQGQVSRNLLVLIISIVLLVSSIIVFIMNGRRKRKTSEK